MEIRGGILDDGNMRRRPSSDGRNLPPPLAGSSVRAHARERVPLFENLDSADTRTPCARGRLRPRYRTAELEAKDVRPR